MSTDEQYRKAVQAGQRFKPAIISVRYLPETDMIQIATAAGTLTVKRTSIAEFRNVPAKDMKKVYSTPIGLHIDEHDIDINGAGLVTALAQRIVAEVADSF